MKSHKKMKTLAVILMLGLLCGTAFAAPVINSSTPSDKDIEVDIGTNQEFTVTLNESGTVKWFVEDEEKSPSSSTDTFSSYIYAVSDTIQRTIKAVVEGNANASPEEWTIKGSELEITAANPTESNWGSSFVKTITASSSNSTSNFNITTNQNCTIEWTVKDSDDNTVESKSEPSEVKSSSFVFAAGKVVDTFTIKATATKSGAGSDEKTWTLEVVPKGYSSGNRIWDEDLGLSKDEYTWDALSYSGFFYDLDDGEFSEKLTIKDIKRNIDEGKITYSTEPMETDFEYNDWGSYQVIGFMAEKYFAGYNENTTIEGESLDISLIKEGVLAKVLTDTDDKESAYSGSSFILEDGYALNIVEVDVNGNTVWIQLEKDGDVVDDDFLSSNDDYVYEADLGDAEDIPIIIAHVGTVFAGQETSAVFIEGIFQISDNYVEIEEGDSFGEMEIKSASGSGITMRNEDDVNLDEGDTIELMGKILIQVADDSTLRFAPFVDISEPGTYELRGTVYDEDVDGDSFPTWTPFNFEGFYYNIDEGIGTEELRIEDLNGREIPEGQLIYETTPQPVEFEHDNWGDFKVIGFMAEKYFAGYPEDAVNGEIDEVSLLSDNILTKVLTDTDDKESMYSGSALILEEGYALNIQEVDINGEVVWVQLEKDGDAVDDAFVSSNEDYVYETDLGDAEDVPLIIVHFSNVFAGAETNAVFVEGIFQISDDYLEIEDGDTFGEMEISISSNSITMKNEDDINLDEDETIDIMGEVKFKVADSGTVRFYPFVEVETEGGASRELRIDVPDEIIVDEEFTIEVTAGEDAVEDVTVKVNGKTVSKTDEDGEVTYTPVAAGTYKVSAEKEGYTTANKNIEVIEPKVAMTIGISPQTVYIGDTMTIEVVEAIGGDPVEGAEISINGEFLKETDEDGTVTYSTDKPATIKVSATKQGYLDESANVKVRDLEPIFVFSNLVIDPLEVRAEKEATISIDVENTGNAAGDYNVELVVNETVADSQTISLGIGEGTTVTFKHAEEVPGTYTAEVGGETGTYTVLEKSSGLLYGLGALILAIAGGAAYMFTKGGWTVGMVQEKVQELLDSVKPRK